MKPLDTEEPGMYSLLHQFSSNHLLCIHTRLRHADDKPLDPTASGFTIRVGNQVFLITAGHYFTALTDLLQQGARIQECILANFQEGGCARFKINPSIVVACDQDRSVDIAAYPLPPDISRIVEDLGVVPVDLLKIAAMDEHAGQYFMIGCPEQETLKSQEDGQAIFKHGLIQVELERLADDHCDDGHTRLHFTAKHDQHWTRGLNSVHGMSGGPIVEVHNLAEDSVGFRFLGVQSSWIRNTKETFATPLLPFVVHLHQLFAPEPEDTRLIDPTLKD